MQPAPTIVTYSEGDERAFAVITALPDLVEASICIVTDRTPFHPLDPWWPDQPSDRGEILIRGQSTTVHAAVVVGINRVTGEMRLNNDKTIKRSDKSWYWLIGHLVDKDTAETLNIGDAVELAVDHSYRAAIAAGHSGCHVAALALNQVASLFWEKEVSRDCLGNPDTDQELIVDSRIVEYGSIDRYRIGRSARKAGFAHEKFWAAFAGLAPQIAEVANLIAALGGRIMVEPQGTTFDELRTWTASFGDQTLFIPCGGVHSESLSLLAPIDICLERIDESEFKMTTTAHKAR